LTANVASTVLSDVRISPQSVLAFHPRTANAAAELGNGTLYVTDANMGNGTATITHANNAQVDRSFRVAIIG
jgi:DNA-binding beta-propeller fold protein YncE